MPGPDYHILFDTDLEAFTARTGLDRADVIREAERLWEELGE